MFEGLVHANSLKLSENCSLFYRVRGAYINRGDHTIRHFTLDDSKITGPEKFATVLIDSLLPNQIVLGFWEEESAEMKCRGQVEHRAASAWQATSPLHIIKYANTAIYSPIPESGKKYDLLPCQNGQCTEAIRIFPGMYILLNPGYQVLQASPAL